MVLTSSAPSIPVCRERVLSVHRQEDSAACVLANRTNLRVPGLLASYVAVGDEITFPIPAGGATGAEIYITKGPSSSGLNRCLYQAPVGYVTQPKLDKRNQHFVSAEVQQKALGICAILLPCGALRDYFYILPGVAGKDAQPNFYETLRIPASASPAELRVAYKLRTLEVAGSRSEQAALDRAFNILGRPELRACYDALLADPEAPAIFPYGGFGSLLVSGERSRDGQTFFAQRILAFSPERRHRRFHMSLHQCDFYEDRALCRDVRRKLEFWLDPALLHTLWDPTWNQWKHLLATKNGDRCDFCSKRQVPQTPGRVGTRYLGNSAAEPTRRHTPGGLPTAGGNRPCNLSPLRPIFSRAGADPSASPVPGHRKS